MPSVSRIRRHMSLAHVIEGELDGSNRRRYEHSVKEHLTASKMTVLIDEREADHVVSVFSRFPRPASRSVA